MAAVAAVGLLLPAATRAAGLDSIRIVLLPDTQFLVKSATNVWRAQMEWIRANRDGSKIAAVLHEGDLVDDSDSAAQWQSAMAGLAIVSNRVPILVTQGNHDQAGLNVATHIGTNWNQWLPQAWYTNQSWWGGGFYTNDSSECLYVTVTNGGWKLLLVSLPYGYTPGMVTWAKELMDRFPDHLAMLVTHNFLAWTGERNLPEGEYGPDTAEAAWQTLREAANLRFVFNGHYCDQGHWPTNTHNAHRTDPDTHGHPVNQIFCNWQTDYSYPGYLLVLTLLPARGEARVETYSPRLKQTNKQPANTYIVPLDWGEANSKK